MIIRSFDDPDERESRWKTRGRKWSTARNGTFQESTLFCFDFYSLTVGGLSFDCWNRCAERIKCRLLSVCLRCETARETESRLVWHLTRRSRGDLLRKSVAISRSEETSGTRQEAVGCSGRRVAAREVCFSQSWHGGCNFCCRCDDRRCDTSR